MNTIKKLSELAVYLKRAVETYSQRDYEQLHQELCARCDQLIMEAFMWIVILDGALWKVMRPA